MVNLVIEIKAIIYLHTWDLYLKICIWHSIALFLYKCHLKNTDKKERQVKRTIQIILWKMKIFPSCLEKD